MAKSPTGIIPESFMRPGAKMSVMAYLINLPVTGDEKVEVFKGWAKAVGVTLSASELNTVRHSGSDR